MNKRWWQKIHTKYNASMSKAKQRPYLIGCFLFVALVLLLYWFLVWHDKEYTNDAYVHGNQVYITSLHPGFVTSIHTDDSFLVKKGQLLIELDETDAKIALEKAKKQLARVVREVCQAFHNVFILKAEIGIQEARLLKARQDFKHRKDVIGANGVSLENYEHAVDDLQARISALKRTQSRYQKALAFIQGTTIPDHPDIQAAAQSVRDAWVRLYRCKIYAPVDGLVAQRTIQVGMWVKPERPLMSVIPLDQIWINANYKETQLKHIRIGQNATITSDLYGYNTVFHGKIVGLPGGAGNVFSLLPPQNLSGNWIKIVQRLPVRIALDPGELKQHPLRIGLSMEVTTNISTQSGLLVPTSSKGSPHYVTSIFKEEELGVQALIAGIITSNADPELKRYMLKPFIWSDR